MIPPDQRFGTNAAMSARSIITNEFRPPSAPSVVQNQLIPDGTCGVCHIELVHRRLLWRWFQRRAVDLRQNQTVRILASSIFERIVYHCTLVDAHDPAHPVLIVDALLRDGDADGPILVPVADFKRMLGFEATSAALRELRRRHRTLSHDGIEYVTFPLWERAAQD